jgi:hypothetical protein
MEHRTVGKDIRMIAMEQRLSSPHVVAILALGWVLLTATDMGTAASQQSLDWSLRTSKEVCYPGEPVLMTLRIKNNGDQQEGVDFQDPMVASSMEVRDISGEVVVAKGGSTRRPEGGLRPGPLQIPPGQMSNKSIILNRWCSSLLLPASVYEVVCHVEYRLRSELQAQPGTAILKAGPVHVKDFRLSMRILPMDTRKFKDVLEEVRKQAFPTARSEKIPTLEEEATGKEMLALAESTLAVPYQLEILTTGGLTPLGHDAINSLVRSKTLDAAVALMKLVEKRGSDGTEGDLVEGVYRMRETGQPEIITVTDEFIQKYKRPARLR